MGLRVLHKNAFSLLLDDAKAGSPPGYAPQFTNNSAKLKGAEKSGRCGLASSSPRHPNPIHPSKSPGEP